MPRILVVAPNWIGDALMAQPLLGRLRAKRPGVELDVLAAPWVAAVVRRMPEVDQVVLAPFSHGRLQLGARWRLGRSLAARRYDEAIVLPNTWKSALVPFVAGIPLRSGYVGESRYGLLNRLYKNRTEAGKAPMALHYARLSEAPDAEPAAPLPQPRLSLAAEDVEAVQAKFRIVGRYAALCPGAEYGPAKRWPYFAQLGERLGVPAVIVGSTSDAPAAQGIPGRNLTGQTTLDEAIALIAGAAFVVSNDSGLMHVAAALGRPQVALFGSSSPEHTPPQSSAARVLWLRLECSPCYQRECPLGHFRCMRDISVDQVLSEIARL